jgi:acetylornithine deacetylase/succinyl-diaminopimelate desuccinylase-like protein
MPDQHPLEVQREIEGLIARIRREDPDIGELDYDMNVFMNQWGSECDPEQFIFQAVARAHENVLGKPPDITAVPFASDACELVRHGIPALNYGPSGRTRQVPREGRHWAGGESDWNPAQGEHLSIDDLYNCTKVYCSLILDVCNRSRAELGLK